MSSGNLRTVSEGTALWWLGHGPFDREAQWPKGFIACGKPAIERRPQDSLMCTLGLGGSWREKQKRRKRRRNEEEEEEEEEEEKEKRKKKTEKKKKKKKRRRQSS